MPVQAFRRLLAQRRLATLLCAAALLLKLLVPSGFMVTSDHGRPFIGICSGTGALMPPMAMRAARGDMSDPAEPNHHGKAELPCAFAGLSAAATGAIDPLQLAALIAFVMTIGFVRVLLPLPDEPTHLRPPLRGPPARH